MKRVYNLVAATLMITGAHAAPLTVCDFENYPVGTTWTLWHSGNDNITSTATVEIDPTNTNNKVLHIALKEWGCHPEFKIPTELRGKALTDRYPTVTCDIYRSEQDNADNYKQFAVFIGTQEVYRDESYPYQGDLKVWQHRKYTMNPADDNNTEGVIRLGLHHNNTDYYIDNICLAGEFDDYITTEDGGTLDHCTANTDKSYRTISDNIFIPGGHDTNVRTSRYTEWTGKVAGEGTLNIYSGGERSYIGTKGSKGATWPDWSAMKGVVNIYPYKEVVANCGFYGLVLSSGTFQPDNLDASRCNEVFKNSKVVLHDGATISIEQGTRGIRFGELNTEAGSTLDGFYKKNTAKSYYVVGTSGTDGVLAGKIHASNSGNSVGLIKEGKGTYTITGNENNINAGIRLLDGTLLIANDAATAATNGKSGATGNGGTLFVFNGTTLGGSGSIGAQTEVYGTVRPGMTETGTLTFADYTASAGVNVTLHPEANIVCRVKNAKEYACLDIHGTLAYNNKTQEFEDSEKNPRLTIALTDDAALQVNDEITLLTTTKKDGSGWSFRIRYPKAYTWVVEQRESTDGSYSIVAKVTSLDYGGQGDVSDDDDNQGNQGGYPDDDWTADINDDTPLRTYTARLGKNIGMALGSYRYDCSKDDDETGLVGREFDLLVGENEMKFDATEPSQGSFNYGGSDAVMWVADRHKQEVRGHTLAWHSQVPSWVSKDGKQNNNNFTRRELLDILKNHIFNLVGKYKGRIREWDVCNEVLDDDQSIVRTNPDAYKLRPSIWSTYIGEEFIDSAFVWAHQADPGARLFINEYGAEFMGDTKTEAYYNLIKRLKADGRPIDGCGLQCHLTTGQLDTLKLEKNIRRYAQMDMDCIITELDIALANPSADDALDIQAKEYGAITRVFLRNENCPSMVIWGISDNHSWRRNNPLLFDSGLKPKPAYYNVHAQLRLAAEKAQADGIVAPEQSGKGAKIISTSRHDIYGRSVSTPKGIVIEKNIYSDGSVKVVKRIYK